MRTTRSVVLEFSEQEILVMVARDHSCHITPCQTGPLWAHCDTMPIVSRRRFTGETGVGVEDA